MGAPESYGSGTIPQTSDTQRMLLVKLILTEGGGSSGGGGGGGGALQEVFPGHYGNVAPAFIPPKPHAIGMDLDEPFEEWWWNPDTSAWE